MTRQLSPTDQAKLDEASASIGIEKLREYEAALDEECELAKQLTELRHQIPDLHRYESLQRRVEDARAKREELAKTAALFMVPLLRIMERSKGKKTRKK